MATCVSGAALPDSDAELPELVELAEASEAPELAESDDEPVEVALLLPKLKEPVPEAPDVFVSMWTSCQLCERLTSSSDRSTSPRGRWGTTCSCQVE